MPSVDTTRIASNIAALNQLNALRDVNKNLALHQSRLSTGKRINEAADDPAGLGMGTKLQVRSDSLQRAVDNIGDAKNLLAVAEGGLTKINTIMGKMRIKAEQAASDALGSAERTAIAQDLAQYANEIDDIVNQTTWNDQKLLAGNTSFDFQTSADYDKFTTWTLGTNHAVSGTGAGLSGLATTGSGNYSVSVGSGASARAYMNTVDGYIKEVSKSLSNIGAMVDRLSFKEDTLAIGKVNTDAAYNRIMNADMASEQVDSVKYQILQQTATSMLAQANSAPQSIMQLFR